MRPEKAAVFLLTVFTVLFLLAPAGPAKDLNGWERFKKEYLAEDGRVIDFYQHGRSHSEGQGYAMLLAVAHNDARVFHRCRKWAEDNLQVRGDDRLFAWNWGERLPGQWGVIDMNNATDGDLLIASALLLGAEKWKDAGLKEKALRILESVRTRLVTENGGRLVLLPGYYGFVQPEGLVLNPSYMVFPAFPLFARHDRPAFWKRMHTDCLEILSRCTFTRLELPADWVLWKEPEPGLYAQRGNLYGYEAIRVPLYLAWDGSLNRLPGISKMLDLMDRLGYVPRSVDLAGASVSLEAASAGFCAVYARAAEALGRKEQGGALWKTAHEKIATEKGDYYSHVLYLLSQIQFRP